MKNFATSILASNEVQTSVTRIEGIIAASIAGDPFLTKVQPKLKSGLADLTVSLGRTTDSTYVKLLSEKDSIRDTRYIAFRDYCKAMSSDADAAVANAAGLLVTILKELGWGMHNEGYAVESSLLQALFDKLEKSPASDALTTIGANDRFTKLKATQADFETTYKDKVDAKAKEEYPKIRNCRLSIARYLDAMLSYIDIMAEMDGGVYKTAADKIDEVITEFEAFARNRQTRKKTEDTKAAQDTTKK